MVWDVVVWVVMWSGFVCLLVMLLLCKFGWIGYGWLVCLRFMLLYGVVCMIIWCFVWVIVCWFVVWVWYWGRLLLSWWYVLVFLCWLRCVVC